MKIKQLYNATTATWFGFFARAISFVIVLPLLLKKFDAEHISIWYLFDSILAFQLLLDTGFRVTLIRLVAYSFGGKHVFDETAPSGDGSPRWQAIYNLFRLFKKYYFYLAAIFFFLLLVGGTIALQLPISRVADGNDAWYAWSVLILTTSIRLYYGVYIAVLEGLNKIVFVRTLDACSAIFGVISAFLALWLFQPSLLNLVCCYQFWLLVNCARDQYVLRKIFAKNKINKREEFQILFEQRKEKILYPSIKTGLSSLFSVGTNNATNLVIAQFANARTLAAYLLALRIIYIIRDVSMAPFYSKIPYLSLLRAQDNNATFFRTAKKGMFLSYFVFVLGVLACGFVLPALLHWYKSQVQFVDVKTWIFISFAFLLHRYGAMHVQLQMVGNVIKSHVADGVSALIYVIALFFTYRYFMIDAIPLSLVISYLGFYCWYAALTSYRTYKINLLHFEVKNFIAAFSLFVAGSLLLLYWNA